MVAAQPPGGRSGSEDVQKPQGGGAKTGSAPDQVAGQQVVGVGVRDEQRFQAAQPQAETLRRRAQVGAAIEQQVVIEQRPGAHADVPPAGLPRVSAGGAIAKGGRDAFRGGCAQEEDLHANLAPQVGQVFAGQAFLAHRLQTVRADDVQDLIYPLHQLVGSDRLRQVIDYHRATVEGFLHLTL